MAQLERIAEDDQATLCQVLCKNKATNGLVMGEIRPLWAGAWLSRSWGHKRAWGANNVMLHAMLHQARYPLGRYSKVDSGSA